MIEGIVKKIMMTGINKYAETYITSNDNVQIKVTDDINGNVFYTMCNDFKDVETVTFLNIMDKRMDFFGYEGLASPFLKKALGIFADEANCEVSNVNCFIMKHKETVGLAFYNGFKSGKNILLAKQLEQLGL
jgi:hypothetical protein